MKTKKGEGFSMPKRDRLYPTKKESDQIRELKKQYGIGDEVVVNSREASGRKKPSKKS